MRFSTATAQPIDLKPTGTVAETEKERALIRRISAAHPSAEIKVGSVRLPFGREFHVSAVIDGREVAHDYVSA